MKTLEEQIADFINSELENTGVYWRKDIITGVQALVSDASYSPNGFSDNPLVAEMERRCAGMILVSQAVVTCADVFEQACEPRAPKPEWFGTGEGQWDSWMIWSQSTMSWELWRDSQEHSGLRKFGIRDIQSCLPVSRTGYPAPVGWKVVGE